MYPQVFGKYVLEREIARGGMARVHLATLRGAGGFEKRLVVKQIRDELALDEEFVQRFVDEAKTAVALSHPNIVPVYELGVERGSYYIAMELVEGLSLADILGIGHGTPERLTAEEGAYVGVAICRALEYAHRRVGVIHRDITPRNVLVDEEGQVKIIDFGIATRAKSAQDGVFGSPGHMAPEQLAGEPLTPATDIFAVAALMLEIWTGRAPFRRESAARSELALREPPPRPSEAIAELAPVDEIIGRCLRTDPLERPQDASELSRALRALFGAADEADIARRLGERVAATRRSNERPKSAESDPFEWPDDGVPATERFSEGRVRGAKAGDAPNRASGHSVAGNAIAPSNQARPSTRKVPGAASGAPSTRRVPDSDPPRSTDDPPANADGEAAPPSRDARASDRRVPSTRRIVTRSSPPADRDPIDAEPSSTTATRPAADSRTGTPAWPSPLVWIAVAAAAGAMAWWLARSPAPNAEPHVTPSATTSAEAPSHRDAGAPTMAITPRDAGHAAIGPDAAESPVAPSPRASSSGRIDASATEATHVPTAEAVGQVVLLGEPGTLVRIDGQERGACPLRNVELAAREHRIEFVFPPTGERVETTVRLREGDRIELRSEFTGASPRVARRTLPR